MKLNEYQKLSKRTLPKREDNEARKQALANYGLGLTGESGEVVDHIKKHVFHGHELDIGEVRNELGDVLHYLAGLATMSGLSLEDIACYNINKLNKRYPKGFNKSDSINRTN